MGRSLTRVVLTHPLPRIGPLARRLREAGHCVLEMPVRRLEPLLDPGGAGGLRALIESVDWVVFSSPGCVEAAWRALPSTWPRAVGIATVGVGTEQALLAHGLDPACLRTAIVRPARAPYDAAGLMRQPPFDAPCGLRVLVLRGATGRDDWIDGLRERGARVECLAVHRSAAVPLSPEAIQRARGWLGRAAQEPLCFVFTTRDAIAALSEQLPMAGRERVRALAVHPRLVSVLHDCGWAQASLLEPGEAGLLAGLQ